jgi:UDP-N-acetylglucosamine acyltransferase
MGKRKVMNIHTTAIVSPDACIEEGAEIGAYSIIGKGVRIGKNTTVATHVVIEDGAQIGENCRIFQFASIGGVPQDLKFRGEETRVFIGNNNTIREFVTIHRATIEDIGMTVIGDHNLIMAYSHVAHNCQVGNHAILANATNLAGHVIVEDYAILGGMTGVHQFTRIGAHSMIGGASAVSKDVPPFVTAWGNRAKLYGLNLIGMKRRGFSESTIRALKDAYRIIFRSGMLLSQAVVKVRAEVENSAEIQHFLEFIQMSKRGVCR